MDLAWRSTAISSNTKLRVFNNVLAVLLYNSETRRMTETDENKLNNNISLTDFRENFSEKICVFFGP